VTVPLSRTEAPGAGTAGAIVAVMTEQPALPLPDPDETGPYVHLGFATARPGAEAAVERLILDLVEPLRAEAGALEFHVHRDRADPRRFVIYEMYRSRDELLAHLSQPYTQAFIEAMKPHVEGPLRQQFLRMCSPLPVSISRREGENGMTRPGGDPDAPGAGVCEDSL
jgi:quinol monooxygenase YgiN